MNGTHPLRAGVLAAVALAAVVGITGCTQQKPKDPGAYPETAAPSEPAKDLPGLTASTPPPAAKWPKKAVTADKAPHLGENEVIADGYTVETFLKGLASRWDIALGKQKLIDAPRDRKVWHFSGEAPGTGKAVAGVPTKNGDITTFSCLVDSAKANAKAFLEDCARTGIPGWDEKKAVAWLKEAKKQVDALYAEEQRSVVSPMFVSEGAYAVLRKSGSSQNPDGTYDLTVSGGGIAENS
ncbi:hypothetical protein ACIQNU_20000 [Streptomyces sp. NPDC091292]|uniref:hypothetical protein n=1 Tax=Streptomyces sp. NPDC091292 TaxID=3365991 RepID=UPI00380F1616